MLYLFTFKIAPPKPLLSSANIAVQWLPPSFSLLVFYPFYVKVEALPILASRMMGGGDKSNNSEKCLIF